MKRLAVAIAALLAPACQLYSLQSACGPGFDGGACVIPGGAGTSAGASTSSGASTGIGTTGGQGSTGAASTSGGHPSSSSSPSSSTSGAATGASTSGAGSSSGGGSSTGAGASSGGSTSSGGSSGGVVCASGWTAAVVTQSSLPGGLNLQSPEALALVGGLLYVADVQTGALFSINVVSGSAAEVNGPATQAPVSLAAVDGGLLIGNTGRDIWFESLPGAQGTDLVADSQGTFDFGGLTANAAGTAYYIDTQGPVGCFYSFNYQSGATSAVPYGDAGCGSSFLNGPIDKAQFNLTDNPQGLAFDPTGTLLYVADEYNDLIRSVDLASGQVTTLAGTPGAAADADGAAGTAGIVEPLALAVDTAGDVFVAEASGNVREITLTPSATVQTLYDQNCGDSLSIGTDSPVGLAVNPAGTTVYISDSESIAIWSLTHP